MKLFNVLLITLIGLGALAAIAMLVGLWAYISTPTVGGLNAGTFDSFNVAGTNSSSSVSTAGTTVLSANADRIYARITNDSANTIWCAIGDTITANHGLRLNATSSNTLTALEFGLNHIPSTGSVYCVAETSTSTVSVLEN